MTKLKFTTPLPPSVNHAYFTDKRGRRILTGKAKAWLAEAGYIARQGVKRQKWRYSDEGAKLVMEIWIHWQDNRRRDTNNLHKLIADAFEGIVYKDDCRVLVRDMDFDVDRYNPRAEIVIYRLEG